VRPGPGAQGKETLSLIAREFTQAQVATRMGVGPATVDTYIKRIRRKLGPGNKAHLARLAMELGETGQKPVLPTADEVTIRDMT
jgi:DNA-binding CsgD family transcriptional regulator